MDDLDRRIIQELQQSFPLEPNPYESVANRLDIEVEQLFKRVVQLVESGMIRRIGFSIDSRKMGYSSTLTAIRVSSDRIDQASQLIETYPEITHSYLREDDFNIWFTVIAEDQSRILTILEELRKKLHLSEADLMDLPVKKLFKLDARFK